jgi:hypothetical protein
MLDKHRLAGFEAKFLGKVLKTYGPRRIEPFENQPSSAVWTFQVGMNCPSFARRVGQFGG